MVNHEMYLEIYVVNTTDTASATNVFTSEFPL